MAIDLLENNATTYLVALTFALIIAFLLLQPTSLVKWLQRKNYQYEVTFALYMLTPTEKFIFNSVLFLTLSLLTLATCLYLPNHIVTMSRRAYYYCAGEMGELSNTTGTLQDAAAKATSTALDVAAEASSTAMNAAQSFSRSAYDAAMETVRSAAKEAVARGPDGP